MRQLVRTVGDRSPDIRIRPHLAIFEYAQECAKTFRQTGAMADEASRQLRAVSDLLLKLAQGAKNTDNSLRITQESFLEVLECFKTTLKECRGDIDTALNQVRGVKEDLLLQTNLKEASDRCFDERIKALKEAFNQQTAEDTRQQAAEDKKIIDQLRKQVASLEDSRKRDMEDLRSEYSLALEGLRSQMGQMVALIEQDSPDESKKQAGKRKRSNCNNNDDKYVDVPFCQEDEHAIIHKHFHVELGYPNVFVDSSVKHKISDFVRHHWLNTPNSTIGKGLRKTANSEWALVESAWPELIKSLKSTFIFGVEDGWLTCQRP